MSPHQARRQDLLVIAAVGFVALYVLYLLCG
jgi:hypothetical protein